MRKDGPMDDQWAHPDTAATREQDRAAMSPSPWEKTEEVNEDVATPLEAVSSRRVPPCESAIRSSRGHALCCFVQRLG